MADALYAHLAKGARTQELTALGEDLYPHETALRDWLQSELDGRSDGGEEVYAYLQRHGITREEAVTRRKRREDLAVDINTWCSPSSPVRTPPIRPQSRSGSGRRRPST